MKSLTDFFALKRKSDGKKVEKSKYRKENCENFTHSPCQGGLKSVLFQNIGESWLSALQEEFTKKYFLNVLEFVKNERKTKVIYPTDDKIFTWSRACEISHIKVVIIGQDPYHAPYQAHGLCFSVPVGVNIPPSLENIYKELKDDVNFVHPRHGFLYGWAKQGVLLLNSCLTVEAGKPNSHQGKGWELLTDAVIRYVNDNLSNVVFMLWGSYAHKKCAFINTNKHLVLKSVHPSPLSAHRGFFGSRHFSKANKYLAEHARDKIDWSDLPRFEK